MGKNRQRLAIGSLLLTAACSGTPLDPPQGSGTEPTQFQWQATSSCPACPPGLQSCSCLVGVVGSGTTRSCPNGDPPAWRFDAVVGPNANNVGNPWTLPVTDNGAGSACNGEYICAAIQTQSAFGVAAYLHPVVTNHVWQIYAGNLDESRSVTMSLACWPVLGQFGETYGTKDAVALPGTGLGTADTGYTTSNSLSGVLGWYGSFCGSAGCSDVGVLPGSNGNDLAYAYSPPGAGLASVTIITLHNSMPTTSIYTGGTSNVLLAPPSRSDTDHVCMFHNISSPDPSIQYLAAGPTLIGDGLGFSQAQCDWSITLP